MQMDLFSMDGDKQLKIREILESLDNRIQIEASLGDWKAQVRIELRNLNQILLKKLNDQDDYWNQT